MKYPKIFDRSDCVAGLTWGMHGPFRNYVQRMSDGDMTARNGAEVLATGETFFPLEVFTPDELRFRGSLEFSGHNGMLGVTLQQPWLQRHAGGWELTIVDPFDSAARMPFVVVHLDELGAGTTRLTEAGTDVFMGNYTENTVFDSLRIVWAEEDEAS